MQLSPELIISVVIQLVSVGIFIGVFKTTVAFMQEQIGEIKEDLKADKQELKDEMRKYNNVLERMIIAEQSTKSAHNISCCGGLSSSKLTPVQIEKFFKTCAEKLKEYNLTVDKFYTHAEIGEMCKDGSIKNLLPLNKWLYQNKGKIDLTVLPYMSGNAKQTGNFIRSKIKWYYDKAY